jgi:hypothetical protein
MDLKATLRNRVNPGGFCVAVTYVLTVIVVFVFTAATTRPGNVGLDWIPFILLSVPWYGLKPRLLFPGLIANIGVMYLAGTPLETFWRRVILKIQEDDK